MEPSEDAQEVAETLASSDGVQEEVLLESAETGTESGRTFCGDSAKQPEDRGFNHVDLDGCALSKEGLIHGGGGHDFRSPEHSLIDMAIVLYGRPAASMVVGSEQSDLFLEPSEESLRDARMAFNDAVGEVNSPEDVKRRIENRDIRPTAAREQFRRDASDLFHRVETNHMSQQVASVASSVVSQSTIGDRIKRLPELLIEAVKGAWRFLREVFSVDPREVDVNLVTLLATEVASALILLLFLRAFGGSPKQMVAS